MLQWQLWIVRAIRPFQRPILWFRVCTKSGSKTTYCLADRGPGVLYRVQVLVNGLGHGSATTNELKDCIKWLHIRNAYPRNLRLSDRRRLDISSLLFEFVVFCFALHSYSSLYTCDLFTWVYWVGCGMWVMIWIPNCLFNTAGFMKTD